MATKSGTLAEIGTARATMDYVVQSLGLAITDFGDAIERMDEEGSASDETLMDMSSAYLTLAEKYTDLQDAMRQRGLIDG